MIGPVFDLDLKALRAAVGDGLDAVWWRSCSVHRDREFAGKVVQALEAISVGHCEVIAWPNPFAQRAVCAMAPNEAVPHWRRAGDLTFVNDRGEPLPDVSTLRNRVPYHTLAAWSSNVLTP